MNKHLIIALAAFAASFTVHAAEPVAVPAKPAQTATATPVAAPQKTAAISQQDRMRDCSKQATGKKGADRKTFMKTCLSHKKA